IRVLRRPRICQQILSNVCLELAEHVPLHLVLEDLVPVCPKYSRAHIEISAARSQVHTRCEFGMRTSNDRPVFKVYYSIAIHVFELHPSHGRPILASAGRPTATSRRMGKSLGRILEKA